MSYYRARYYDQALGASLAKIPCASAAMKQTFIHTWGTILSPTLTPEVSRSGAGAASGNFGFSYDALSRRTQMTSPNGLSSIYDARTILKDPTGLDEVRRRQLARLKGDARFPLGEG